ncbi:tRNA methylation protein [Saccharomycopsis crataegensis]|uniref:tRNA methylation protein n=1 Tax=Saccharomycopsis crataegensis TaxID=43959 RepID=A0AAV5QTC7_9ASCO|nr:tRNA methylation protein [Saccharomycopsis crataegensis]
MVEIPVKFISSDCILSEEEILRLKKTLIKNKPADLIGSVDETGTTCIECIFYPIFNTLKSYKGLGDIRLYCADSLAIWLVRCMQIFNHPDADPKLIQRLSGFMTDENSNFVFDYIVDFWNESGSPLSNALRDLLTKMVSFLSLFHQDNEDHITANVFQKWSSKILKTIPHTKRVFYFVIQTLARNIDCRKILKESPNFIEDSLAQMFSNAFANSVAKCVAAVLDGIYQSMKNSEEQDFELKWTLVWKDPVIKSLTTFNLCRNVQIYLLPLLLKVPQQPRPVYKYFINQILDTSDPNLSLSGKEQTFRLSLYLGCLKIGKDLQIDEEPFAGDDPIINLELLKQLLSHESKTIRITSYSILVSSTKRARPVSSYIYGIVEDILEVYFVDDDPDSRSDFHSLTRNFILRVRDSTYALQKKLNTLNSKGLDMNNDEMIKQIEEAKEFLERLLNKIKTQITPGMTYQRLHLAFSLLISMITSGVDENVPKKYLDRKHLAYPFQIQIYTGDIVRLLIDNISNNFDNIRECAINALLMAPVPLEGFSSKESINEIFLRSVHILKNIQGKMSDSGARLLQFVYNYNIAQKRYDENKAITDYLLNALEENIDAASNNLAESVSTHSVHGLYKGLSIIIENSNFDKMEKEEEKEWKQRVDRIIDLVNQNWDSTKDILSNDSPEGNIPDAFKEVETIKQISPFSQIISNYAWRAVKDSSFVLKQLLIRAPNFILSKESVLKISDLILTQLSSVNHKGAFYSIYPTFEECCHRCYRKDSGLEMMPVKWLNDNLSLIKIKSTYIIRRSAGLPFLISMILVADIRRLGKVRVGLKNTPLFKETFKRLIDIARTPINEEEYKLDENIELPQVHAFNCIKQLFIEANLSDPTSFYIDAGLELSFWAIQSGIWSIRNCAVMLFAALENKLFGSKKVGNTIVPYSGRLFFSKFKKLKGILTDNFRKFLAIESGSENTNSNSALESIFPILTILSRLEPTNNFSNDLEDFKPFLLESLGIKYFKIREMAARAIPSSIYEYEIFDEINMLLDRIDANPGSQNELHGNLLAINQLLIKSKRISVENEKIPEELVNRIIKSSPQILFNNKCYMNGKAYIDMLRLLLDINGGFTAPGFMNAIGNYFIELEYTFMESEKLDGMKELLAKDIALLILEFCDDAQIGEFIELGIISASYKVQLGTMRFIIHRPEMLKKLSNECISNIINTLWEIIDDESVWSYIKANALELLQLVSTNAGVTDLTKTNREKLSIFISFVVDDHSEDVKATALQAMGPFIGYSIINKEHDETIIGKWLHFIRLFANDDNILDLRYAACKSLLSMLNVVIDSRLNFIESPVVAKALFYLFLQISDDSEEIREDITKFFCSLYGVNSSVPVFMGFEFVSKFVPMFQGHAATVLLEYFMNYPSLNKVVEEYLQSGEVLFDAEKDNLYVVEFIRYSQIINMLTQSRDFLSIERKNDIKARVVSEWQYMVSFVKSQGADGILGWTTSETTFGAIKMQTSNLNMVYELGLNDEMTENLFSCFQKLCQTNNLQTLLVPRR